MRVKTHIPTQATGLFSLIPYTKYVKIRLNGYAEISPNNITYRYQIVLTFTMNQLMYNNILLGVNDLYDVVIVPCMITLPQLNNVTHVI